MREYTVTWIMQLDAETPRDAAIAAQDMIRDVESDATVFYVTDKDGEETTVDLAPWSGQ